MTSLIHIFNIALNHLGSNTTIGNLSENSMEAETCCLFYDNARDCILQTHPWNFAMKKFPLTLLEQSSYGWNYKYLMPSDCLIALTVTPKDRLLPLTEFEVTGDNILSNQPNALLSYTGRVTDVSLFRPAFISALTWRLAADICPSITGCHTTLKLATANYIDALLNAQIIDSREGENNKIHNVDWISIRQS